MLALQSLEDMEDIFLADTALKQFRESGESLVDLNELETELNIKEDEYPFTLEERQLAAKASAETWEAILNEYLQPFDFKK